jgi:pimeloyl-[acyl-carrier protein] methyl ester esterase
MNIITLSGWGQASDSLSGIAPDALHLDYLACNSAETFMQKLPPSCDILIGWSLGGQLAIRATPLLKPKMLILIATPFALASPEFDAFHTAFLRDPESSLQRFTLLMAHGDSNARNIIRNSSLTAHRKPLPYWLGLLKSFDAATVDFAGFPRTLIIHGSNDAIVSVEQAKQLAGRITGSSLHCIEQCGHAPHLHNRQEIYTIIHNEIPHTT